MTLSSRALDGFSLDALEFRAIIDLLRRFISGPISEPLVLTVEPHTDVSTIRRELDLAREARESLNISRRPSLSALIDPRPVLEKIRIEGVSCSAAEVSSILEVARAAYECRPLFQKTPLPRLDELAQSIPDLGGLVRELNGKILPDGLVDSSASPELARIRRSIERARQELQFALERLLRKFATEEVLQEEIITLRNGRFVLPVRAEKKRAVEGIVHGASSSGASVYIEPLQTLPLNNELVELEDREASEILRILGLFSDRLRMSREDLLNATEALSQLDLAFAKAEFARKYGGCFPEFSQMPELLLKKARHPLLEKTLAAEGAQAVPLSFELHSPQTMMIISGPNTGGKTVALKTIGAAALMAQAGLPVLAEEARLPLFARVLADIGDQQSIEQSLSTFSAHIRNIERMVEVAGENDMVLLDEIGGSTDPQEGAALAVAILEHFRMRKSMTFVTTHHSRLKAYGAQTPEAMNAAMDFDEVTLRPTYKVVIGLPGKSSGLDIAMRLGLDRAIIEQARSLLNPADAEAAGLVASLHAQRNLLEGETERARERARALEAEAAELRQKTLAERHAKLKDLDKRLEQVLSDYDKKWKLVIEEIRSQARGQAQSLCAIGKNIRRGERLGREVREEWNVQVLEARESASNAEEPPIAVEPAVGDRVRLKDFSAPGSVLALLQNNEVEVEVGRLRMRVPRSDLQVLARQTAEGASADRRGSRQGGDRFTFADRASTEAAGLQAGGASRAQITLGAAESGAQPAAEINVIGETAEEAQEHVDKFLDSAFVNGRFKVRVIHGHGKGVLRRTLQEMFTSHPHVEKFYPASPREGGQGATIVELRR
jgi:DNA mismatch repair protein MutS2